MVIYSNIKSTLKLLFLICLIVADARSETVTKKTHIGIIVPLSGSLSEYGNAVRNGVELAKSDFPKEFSSLEIAYEDYQSDPKNALTAFKKLTSSKIDAVIVWGASASEIVAPIAENLKTPLFVVSNNATVSKDRNFVIRTTGDADSIVRPVAEYIKEKNVKTIALVKTEWSYTEELAKALKRAIGEKVSIQELSFNREEMDFKAAISKIRDAKPDMLGIFLGSNQVSQFYRQQSQQNQSFPSFGSTFFGSKKEIAASGPGIEGAVFADYSYCDSFISKYREKFGDDSHIVYAVNIYDTANVIATTALAVQSNEELKFFNEVKKEGTISGACEKFSLKLSKEFGGYFEYPTTLYQIRDGKIQKY